jgi:hypothetical protein
MGVAIECAADHLVTADFDAWAKKTRRASDRAALNKALAAIGLPQVADDDPAVCGEKGAQVRVADVFHPNLLPGTPAVMVQVLAQTCASNHDPADGIEVQVQRAAAYLPFAPGKWCRVDTDFLDQSGSGWGPQLCDPATFGFEKLIAADTDVLHVDQTQEWCGSAGVTRGGETQATWYRIDGQAWLPVFTATTMKSYYESPIPPVEELTAVVSPMGDGFPRGLRVETTVTCNQEGFDETFESQKESAEAPVHLEITCTSVHSLVDWVYEGGTYVAK